MREFSVSVRPAVALLALGALLASGLFTPATSRRAQAPATPPTLDVLMGQINRNYRMVKAQVADKAQNAKTLEALNAMEVAAATAKGMTPTSVSKLPEAQRAGKNQEYRKSMVALLRALIDLEENLLADDNTKAAAVIAKIDEIQKAGHAAFRVDE